MWTGLFPAHVISKFYSLSVFQIVLSQSLNGCANQYSTEYSREILCRLAEFSLNVPLFSSALVFLVGWLVFVLWSLTFLISLDSNSMSSTQGIYQFLISYFTLWNCLRDLNEIILRLTSFIFCISQISLVYCSISSVLKIIILSILFYYFSCFNFILVGSLL